MHKKLLSIRDARTRRVVAHASEVHLSDATFHVSLAGRARVIRDKRKNVHAWVRGVISEPCDAIRTKVTYNPYKYSTFVRVDDATPVHQAASIHIKGKHIAAGN